VSQPVRTPDAVDQWRIASSATKVKYQFPETAQHSGQPFMADAKLRRSAAFLSDNEVQARG
jgi:hypothetical protein